MKEISIAEVDAISGGMISLRDVFDAVVWGYGKVESAYSINSGAYGSDFANELLAAGGLGA